jgi:serralysin
MATSQSNHSLAKSSLQTGLQLALQQFSQFASEAGLFDRLRSVFGSDWEESDAQQLVGDLVAGELPDIRIAKELGGAIGGYSEDEDRIYLSERFLAANSHNPQAIATVILEEIGHVLDSNLNSQDTLGDEGELFAALVTGRTLSESERSGIAKEDDRTQVWVKGKWRSIEQATYGSINVDGSLTDWVASERLDTIPGSGTAGYELYGKYAANNYVFAMKSAVPIDNRSTIWLDTDRFAASGFQIFGAGAEFNIQFDATGKANLYTGSAGQNFISALDYKVSADGLGWEVAVDQNLLNTTSLRVFSDINDTVYLPNSYGGFYSYIVDQNPFVPKTAYGNIQLDGTLTDWSPSERIDTLPRTGQPGYAIYGKNTADGYVFALQSAVAIAANTTIWLDADLNRTTGFQIFGSTGGAEYNINISNDGNAYLYSGDAGQTLLGRVDSKLSTDGRTWEVAVGKNLLTSTTGLNVLADVNNSIFLPGDYNTLPYAVEPYTNGTAGTYGDIVLDGSLVDWKADDRIDFLPGASQVGYAVYGKNTTAGYAFAIQSAVEIKDGTTIWLDTDRNKTTGFQIFGAVPTSVGAEYNIDIAADGRAYLYTGGAGETKIVKLDAYLSADKKTLEVAVDKDRIAAGNGVNVLADVNNAVYLPGDYNTNPYIVRAEIPTNPTGVYGNITVNGNLTDWQQTDRLDLLPGTGTTGYQVFGKSTLDGYVFAIDSAIPIGANSTIWIDADQNKATGFQIFGATPTTMGAEFNINIGSDGNAYLYRNGAGQEFVSKVYSRLSTDGKQWEVAVNKSDLPLTGNGINVVADVNQAVFLPGDYNLNNYTIASTPPPPRTDFSKKVGIVYSETSANKFFDKKSYNQLFANAQNQAMQAGIPFDLLTEADLKDLSKVAQYDALMFPSFSNVKQVDLAAIESVLTKASIQYGVGLITAGDFMTLDENGVALSGNPYRRMQNLFDLQRTASGPPGPNVLKIGDTSGGILSSNYTPGEEIQRYTNLSLSAYGTLNQPGKILARQTVNGQDYNAVIATQTGGRNVHFADPFTLADSDLAWQGLDWSVYGDRATKARVGLNMTRNTSMFISRDDVDESRFLGSAPAVESRLADILTDWKTRFNFVGSHYINIGNNPAAGEGTDWNVMRPIYQRILALGNEIGTHSYTHPDFTSQLTPQQLEFEFNQSKLEIARQLGINITGAAVPGNPETIAVHSELDKYFNYFTGVGTSYNNAFGFLTPQSRAVYFAPNVSFDFSLIDFRKLTPAQAEVVWAQEYSKLTKHGNSPFIEFSWHDYGVTQSEPGYNLAMFENFLARAANDGTEFITLDDAQQRIRAFEQSQLTVTQVGDVVTAQVGNATNVGKFAVDIDAPGKTIKSVTNYYAYDDNSVFTSKTGGTYTINLGTSADDVSHITALAARSELISVTGNGTDLSFTFNGEGKIKTDMKAITADQRYRVTGADGFTVTGDKLELSFTNNANHVVSVSIVPDSAPVVTTPIPPITITGDWATTREIDLSLLFSDIDRDAITTSLVSNSNTSLANATLVGNKLTLTQTLYEFGTTTLTVRGTAGGKSVDTSFNVIFNPISNLLVGTNNAEIMGGSASHDIMKGLNGSDRISGGEGNDVIIGGGGSDFLYGNAGNDILFGTNTLSPTPGRNSRDHLEGGTGSDRYVLGDAKAVYYNDGNNASSGGSDYGAIVGFETGDTIQLKGQAADYTLSVGTVAFTAGQGTIIQSNLFGQPEIIGFVAGATGLSLTSSAFLYV